MLSIVFLLSTQKGYVHIIKLHEGMDPLKCDGFYGVMSLLLLTIFRCPFISDHTVLCSNLCDKTQGHKRSVTNSKNLRHQKPAFIVTNIYCIFGFDTSFQGSPCTFDKSMIFKTVKENHLFIPDICYLNFSLCFKLECTPKVFICDCHRYFLCTERDVILKS